MSKRGKLSPSEKIKIAQDCIAGKFGICEAATKWGVDHKTISVWVSRYRAEGTAAFRAQKQNRAYTSAFKQEVVEEYLAGGISQQMICEKYKIRSRTQLAWWIKVYNRHEDFKGITGGSAMTTPRKTTFEERLAITKACIAAGKNYGEFAIRYNVSYQQVYQWVQRFENHGEAGLEDRRGQRILNQSPRTPEEEMKIRIAQLEHENYMLKVERDLLKKAKD